MYVIMRKADGLFYRKKKYGHTFVEFGRATVYKQVPTSSLAYALTGQPNDWRLRGDIRMSQLRFRFLNSYDVKKVKVTMELDNG